MRPLTKKCFSMKESPPAEGVGIYNLVLCTKPMTVGGFRWKIQAWNIHNDNVNQRVRWWIQKINQTTDVDNTAFTLGAPFAGGNEDIIAWGTLVLESEFYRLESILHPDDEPTYTYLGWRRDGQSGDTNSKRKLAMLDSLVLCVEIDNNDLYPTTKVAVDIQWVEWY